MTIWCERPTPSVKRPPAMACAESACCAIACGWRGKVGITAVPSSMRRVSRAQSAAAMIASIPMMLANQPLAKPSASARLACATSPSTPAEGQRAILAGYGIAEDAIGAPIRSSMETVHLGTTDDGIPLHFDRAAHEADHVAIVNRVKPHTNFSGEIESGILKMTMIGLGKHTGAALCHRAIVDHGFDRVARSAGRALFVRELTPETRGNAYGIGLADFTTSRLIRAIDYRTTVLNCLTAANPEAAALPIHYDTDREAIDAALASAGLAPAERARVVRIRNTLRLDRLFVSEACRAELAARGDVEIVEPAHELAFDGAGNLPPLPLAAQP